MVLNIIYHSPHGKPQKLSALSRGVFIVDVIALWLEKYIKRVYISRGRLFFPVERVVHINKLFYTHKGAIFDFLSTDSAKLLIFTNSLSAGKRNDFLHSTSVRGL